MAINTRIDGDLAVTGTVVCSALAPGTATITNAMIPAGANVDGSKLQHENPPAACGVELFGPTTTVAALTKTLGMAAAAGTLLLFRAWIEVVATGADRTITVDLQKSTGGGAYATVLSATIGFTNVSTIRSSVAAAFASASFVAGDIFRAVVTVAGAAGAQATGLTVNLVVKENPQ